jgi:hypothetical protein
MRASLASSSSAATRAAWSRLQQYELTSEGITLLRYPPTGARYAGTLNLLGGDAV